MEAADWRSRRENVLVAPVCNILWLPQVFSPVLQASSQMFLLWEDHLPLESGFPDSSPWGFLIPFEFDCPKQVS